MKITVETIVDGKKDITVYNCDFCFLVNGNEKDKSNVELSRYIHFEKVDEKKNFDRKHALVTEFIAIKTLLEHFEKALKFELGLSIEKHVTGVDVVDILEKFLKE